MGTISDKLTYLNVTKTKIREGLNSLGADLDTQDTFRSYVDAIDGIYEDYPKITGEGTDLSLDNTKQAPMKIVYKGQTSQDGTPTPSSPIPVNVVSGDNTIDICGKNLFDGEIELGNINPSDGSLTSNNSRTRSKNYIKVKPNTTYTMKRSVGSSRWVIGYTKGKVGITDGNFQGYASALTSFGSISQPQQFTTSPTTEYIKWYDTNSTDLEEQVMIIKGNYYASTMPPYEPYQGASYPINLGTLELCKIGTYQDYIYKTNKWYLHKEIRKVVLDGSETYNWFDAGITNVKGAGYTINEMISTNYGYGFSNYFSNPRSDRQAGTIRYGANNKDIYLYVNVNDFANVGAFKTWLSTHNTIVYYVLTTPTNTEITDTTLINQLEESKLSYISQTNISQENNDAPFILDVKALRGE